MATKQTWKINGQTYTHEQLMEMKRKKINPHKQKVELKTITPRGNVANKVETPAVEAESVVAPVETPVPDAAPEAPVAVETPAVEAEKLEFEEMKKAKAWLKPELNARYNELKKKFSK